MSEYTYNMPDGNFFIDVKNIPEVLKALWSYALETARISGTAAFTSKSISLTMALAIWGFESSEDDEGNIISIYLLGSHFGDEQEKVFEILAPFVKSGSYLVFAYGGADGCWAFRWDADTNGKIQCRDSDVVMVLQSDMQEILAAAKSSETLWQTMKKKYSIKEV